MRILGIDPGLRVTGFGVIDVSGHRLAYVASGVIRTPTADLATRLGTIFQGVSTLVREHAPDQAAIEQVFVNVNPQSTLLLGQARGAAICGLVAGGLPVAEYTALQLKQAVVGYGRATKSQMQEMVTRLLNLSGQAGQRRGRRARDGDLPCTQRQYARHDQRPRAGARAQGPACATRAARRLTRAASSVRRATRRIVSHETCA